VEQEPLEVLEMMALTSMRRGEQEEALRILDQALELAARIPNVMEGRIRQTRERALQPIR
jgi:hypothetical protein